MVRYPYANHFIYIALWIIQIPLEYYRLRVGYRGNLQETIPELISFLILTIFFVVPLSILPFIQQSTTDMYPHETTITVINLFFVVMELIVGCIVTRRVMHTQSTTLFLRQP